MKKISWSIHILKERHTSHISWAYCFMAIQFYIMVWEKYKSAYYLWYAHLCTIFTKLVTFFHLYKCQGHWFLAHQTSWSSITAKLYHKTFPYYRNSYSRYILMLQPTHICILMTQKWWCVLLYYCACPYYKKVVIFL
jgi:hypothetical protein